MDPLLHVLPCCLLYGNVCTLTKAAEECGPTSCADLTLTAPLAYLTQLFCCLRCPAVCRAACSTLTKAAEECGPTSCADLTLTAPLAYLTQLFCCLRCPAVCRAACSTLTKAAEECGPTGCADLTLTAELDTFLVGAAILEGDATGAFSVEGALTAGDPGCNDGNFAFRKAVRQAAPTLGRMDLRDDPNPFGWVFNRTAERKQVRLSAKDEGTTPVAFLSTYGSGPVTISNREHESRWEAGWVSLFAPGVIETQVPKEDLPDIVEVFGQVPTVPASDAGKYKFVLYKHEERY